jgi:HlyD family secretion protein
MKKKMIWLLVLSVLIGGTWFVYANYWGSQGKGDPTIRTAEATASQRSFVKVVLATGSVKPEVGAQVNVGARLSGKVDKLNAAIGDQVEKGQVLAIIEHKDLAEQVSQQESQLAYVRTQIDAEKSRLAAELDRAEALIEQRKSEVETEKRRLVAIREQRQRTLAGEEGRLESVRQQRGAEIKLAKAQILEADATNSYAEKDVKRMQTLFEKGMLAEQTLDRAVTDQRTARSRLNTSKETKTLSETRLAQDVAVQEEVVELARAALTNDVRVQEETVRKAEAALAVTQLDRATIATSSAAALQVLEASLPRLESTIREMKIRVSYAKVKSPIGGVVGNISTQEGETVAAGFNAPTFVTVVDLSRLQVDAYVDEVDIGKVTVGQSATFTVDAFPDTEFKGEVLAIYPSAILLDNVVYYDVVIGIEGTFEGRLRPEMTANVTIEVAARNEAVAVPQKSIKHKDGKTVVRVKTGTDSEEREVTTGLEEGDFVEVQSGLEGGETVLYEEKVKTARRGGGGRK